MATAMVTIRTDNADSAEAIRKEFHRSRCNVVVVKDPERSVFTITIHSTDYSSKQKVRAAEKWIKSQNKSMEIIPL